jgi:hypothetical protein
MRAGHIGTRCASPDTFLTIGVPYGVRSPVSPLPCDEPAGVGARRGGAGRVGRSTCPWAGCGATARGSVEDDPGDVAAPGGSAAAGGAAGFAVSAGSGVGIGVGTGFVTNVDSVFSTLPGRRYFMGRFASNRRRSKSWSFAPSTS